MAIVEEFVGKFSPQGVILAVATLTFILLFAQWADALFRLHKLGGNSAPKIPTKLPFGMGVVYRMMEHAAKNENLELWNNFFAETGRTYTVESRILTRRIFLTADPENIKAILAAQFNDYGKGEAFHREWKPFLGDSIFTTDGEKWHTSRQLIRPQFIKDRVSDLHCFEDHVATLFKCMAKGDALDGKHEKIDINMKGSDGAIIEISNLLFRYTLDVATDFLLGKDVESMCSLRQPFADAFNEVQAIQNNIARVGPFNWLIPRGRYKACLKIINEFLNQYIERALRLSPEELASKTKGDRGYTFLHALASHTRDRTVLRDQLVAVLLAGRDTTAATLSWAIYELARHPEAVNKLRQEILHTVGPTQTPTYAHLKSMKYLQNIMNETLRLYPVVPFNVRGVVHDTTLPRGGGPDGSEPIAVLKGTSISYSTLAMQRRPDLYPPVSENFADPAVFSPDRWFHWQPKPWTYIPFNGGPRICVGQQFALTEMAYVLCRIFQRFDRIDSHMGQIDGGKPNLRSVITLSPHDGVRVALWRAKGGL
ncbi:hypothetical protein MKZ38_007163 [Zalerion maritima]|uniref:Cytochrome P450 alkane hydroxylase n=1 Tax=Zalerion maritima TaxID=339359 RepID=A0AAD5WW18_9PEZI|nr:hypothetical protein MKZ38_007163 [Zalerion maritima]